jgi:hypothetical protein
MLAAFFLLGVILGFFVVRNWKQEQESFLKSMAAALGGAFATMIAPNMVTQLQTPQAFALGFTLPGAVNLLAFAVLSAGYTMCRSQTRGTLVEVLYGPDLAGALDKHFEENFQQAPIFARRMLIHSMELHRLRLLKELAQSYAARRWQLPPRPWVPEAHSGSQLKSLLKCRDMRQHLVNGRIPCDRHIDDNQSSRCTRCSSSTTIGRAGLSRCRRKR